MKAILILILLFVFSLTLNSQNWTDHYTTANTSTALCNDQVNSIAADAQGNFWFGTADGVSEFNGTNWITYTSANGLASDNVLSVAIDSHGNKWFCTSGGISKFDGVNWSTYMNDMYIKTLTVDGIGNIWFGTLGYGVIKFDGTNWTTYTDNNSGLINNTINSIAIDANNNVWIGTNGGVSVFNGTTWNSYTSSNGLVNNYINAISIDLQGDIWFGTLSGVSEFNGTNWMNYTTSNGLITNYITSIAVDSIGNLYFGTLAYGVMQFDGTNWTNYNPSNGLVNNSVFAITINNGILWFGYGNLGGGASSFNGTNWTNYNTANGLPDNQVNTMLFDAKGKIWFGTGDGVTHFDGSNWTTYNKSNGLEVNMIYGMALDTAGNLWIGYGGEGGITKFDGINWTTYYNAFYVQAITVDSKNNIWIGTNSSGVYKFDGTNWTNYKTQDGLADNDVYCITIDNSGNKWIGTLNGVSRFDGTNWTTYNTTNGLVYNLVQAINIDNKGNKWICTNNGISMFNDTIWTSYTTSNGLASNDVKSMTIDSLGNKWFGTDAGLSKFDGFHWINDTINIGLPPANTIDKVGFDKNGHLWVATAGGVSKMDNPPSISVSSNKLNLPATANNDISLTIYSTVDWNIRSNQSWLTVNKTAGSDTAIIKLIATDNPAYSSRKTTLVVSGSGLPEIIISVTQAATIPALSVSTDSLNSSYASNNQPSVTVYSNIGWNINSKYSWITPSVKSGSDTSLITFDVSANRTINQRIDTVTVSGNDVQSRNIIITQDAGPAILTVSENSVNVSYASNSKTSFTINSNIGWEVNSNYAWITPGVTSGSDTALVTLYALANPAINQRIDTVTVYGNGVASQKIIVKQTAGPATLSVSKDTLYLSSKANNVRNFTVNSNEDWTLTTSKSQTWLTPNITSGSDTALITLQAFSNYNSIRRTDTVTIAGNGVPSQLIIVTQEAGPSILNVSENSVNVTSLSDSQASFTINSNIGWDISSNYSWIEPSLNSGSDTVLVTLDASANPTINQRIDTVTVYGIGVLPQKISVTQAAGPATLSISTDTLNLGADAGNTSNFTIYSNENWTLTTSKTQSWLSPNDTSGTDTSLITVKVLSNKSTNHRIDTITISGNNVNTQKIIVTQSAESGTGINNIAQAEVSLYPVPVIDNLTISIPKPPSETNLIIYSLNGIEVYSSGITNAITTVDMSKYTSGVYFIKIISSNLGIITRKVIKE